MMIRRGFVLLAALSASVAGTGQTMPEVNDDTALSGTIAALDTKVFDAYNQCDLVKFGNYFSPTVEFYHDKGGATFDRATVVANTRKYICHKVRRELIGGTLHVFPIKGFGAIAEGEHRFCQIGGECEGAAKFLMIWRKIGAKWQITRVISYGHRALTEDEKAASSNVRSPASMSAYKRCARKADRH